MNVCLHQQGDKLCQVGFKPVLGSWVPAAQGY